MIRYFLLSFLLVAVCVVGLAGFRGGKMAHPPIEIFPDMDHQPKVQPQHPSEFFADGRGARQPVKGTIPMGYNLKNEEQGFYYQVAANNRSDKSGFTNQPDYFNTGHMGDVYGDGFPEEIKVDAQLLSRGRERFEINCKICHGGTGNGDGIVQKYGLGVVSLLTPSASDAKSMPDGRLFSIITNGKNLMGAYGPQISVEDRWAIVAYVRALQRARMGVSKADLASVETELSPEQKEQLKNLK